MIVAKEKFSNLSVSKYDDKFVVCQNGSPIVLPPINGGPQKITEFDTKQDAETYMKILQSLGK